MWPYLRQIWHRKFANWAPQPLQLQAPQSEKEQLEFPWKLLLWTCNLEDDGFS